MITNVNTKWYFNGEEIKNVDEFIQNLSDENLDRLIWAMVKYYKKQQDKGLKLVIKDLGATLFVVASDSLIIASNFNDGNVKNILLGVGLATLVPALIGTLKIKSKQKKHNNQIVEPAKEIIEKLIKQKEMRQLGKDVFSDLY